MYLDSQFFSLFDADETVYTIATDRPPRTELPRDAEHDWNTPWTFELAVRKAEALLGHRDGRDAKTEIEAKTIVTDPLAGW